MHSWVFDPVEIFGSAENSRRKFNLWPAAHPLFGQVSGLTRLTESESRAFEEAWFNPSKLNREMDIKRINKVFFFIA